MNKYQVKFLSAPSANQKVLRLLNLDEYIYEPRTHTKKALTLSEEDHKIFKEIVRSSKSKLILGAFTPGYNSRLVGLMSFRFTDEGVKRINTVAFTKRQGVGTALVRRLCEFTSELYQYSDNTSEAAKWVIKLGMDPGEELADGRQRYHWDPDQVKEFLERTK